MNKKIYLGGGCFWGVEEFFKRKGVLDTTVGYANSDVENPSYELVCSGSTHAVEAVEVVYNCDLVEILKDFFSIIDPTLINRQAMDIGTQYRTGIYFIDEEDEKVIKDFIDSVKDNYKKPIQTEVLPLKNFYIAEEYHQDYLVKNPGGYCHIKF